MAYPVHYIHESMRGAPQLSGTRGTLIALLDAFLVTGFGQVTANGITVAGGVATASLQPGQGFSLHANVLVDGATPAALNGVSRVIEATETSIKFPTSAPDGVATGSITIKVAPVGWQKVYSAANKAVYRSTDVQGARHELRVDETGTANLARVRGYEAMTTVDAGTGLYPTNAQINGGGYWSKSIQANSTPVMYDLVADSRFFLLRNAPGSFTDPALYDAGCFRGFGDPIALSPSGDIFASCLSCGNSSDSSNTYGGFDWNSRQGNGGQYAARAFAGTGTAVALDTRPFVGNADYHSGVDPTMGDHPSPVDGVLRLSQRYLFEANGVPRAVVPGVLHVPQSGLLNSSIQPRDYIMGAGPLAGRVLVALPVSEYVYSGRQGMCFVDITGPWR